MYLCPFYRAVQLVIVRDPKNEEQRSYMNLMAHVPGAEAYITAAWSGQQIASIPERFTVGNMSVTVADGIEYINAQLNPDTRYGYFIRYIIENDADLQQVSSSYYNTINLTIIVLLPHIASLSLLVVCRNEDW